MKERVDIGRLPRPEGRRRAAFQSDFVVASSDRIVCQTDLPTNSQRRLFIGVTAADPPVAAPLETRCDEDSKFILPQKDSA
jgi:hypothetical protein